MRMAVFFFAFSLFASGLNIAKAGGSARRQSLPAVSSNTARSTPKRSNHPYMKLSAAVLALPYLYGGTDDNGYDCSGFVWRVFREAGVDFNRNSARTSGRSCPKPLPRNPRVSARWYSSRRGLTTSASCATRIRFTTPRHQGASCCLISINSINIGEAR